MLSNFYSTQSAKSLLSEADTLAVLSFSQSATDSVVPVRLENLDGTENLLEVWKAPNQTVARGANEQCQWSRSDDYQFVSITLPLAVSDDVEQISADAYRAILQTINESDYPQLVRFWNIIPHINRGEGDGENYKRFCSGRLAAFTKFGIDDAQFPAASAIGHYKQGITVYGLSAKHDPTNIANPRQVNAYRYPSQYGPSSPSFARATTIAASSTEDRDLCFISGTASILGHNTIHVDDLHGQLHTTNDNILYLLKEVGLKRNEIKSVRAYVRHPEHFADVKQAVTNWHPNAQTIFTHADICRDDLLVEIECFCVAG